jgi:diaminopimelate epimerase
MRFVKMHGIGNDYIYIDTFSQDVTNPEQLAVRIADRHFGVGGDGLILISAPSEEGLRNGAHVRMRMFNSDGSESEMCGNGVRCVAKYAFDRKISIANPMRVETGRGVLTLDLWILNGRVNQATVNMGQPILDPKDIPVHITGVQRVVNYPWKGILKLREEPGCEDWDKICGLEEQMTCLSMGNPHVVFYCKNTAKVPLEKAGPLIERHEIFPRRVNVHFVELRNAGEITMRTWERGSGITLGCGTGAAAVCVAGVLTGKTNNIILANLPGGRLALKWNQTDQCVYMTGPAVEVYSGEWPDKP